MWIYWILMSLSSRMVSHLNSLEAGTSTLPHCFPAWPKIPFRCMGGKWCEPFLFHGSIFLHHSLWLLPALVLSRSPETVEGLTDLPALFTRGVGLKSAWCVSACSFLFIVFSFIHPSIQHSSSQEYRSYQTTDNQEPVAPALFKAALCSSLHVSISFFIGHMWADSNVTRKMRPCPVSLGCLYRPVIPV